MSVPFVGRRREVEVPLELIARARREHAPALVVITGDPGSGKSRLLAEIVDRIARADVLRITGFEPSRSIPLAAASELLRRLARVPEHGPVLDRLVFGGAEQAAGEPLRIFEAAHRALRAFGPAVLCLDDLQWVDERSQALVTYLVRAAASGREELVVLAAGRPAPAPAAMRAFAESTLPAHLRALIDIGPLDRPDGVALARSIDERLDDEAATALWHRAGGSPFWLEVLAARGTDRGGTRLVEDRLAGLSGDAGALAALLAVAARPFLAEDLGQVQGWEAARLRHATLELVARGLAVDGAGGVRLGHDLIRETLDRALPAASRKRLHAALAAWMERVAGDDVQLLGEALRHRDAADLPAATLAVRLVGATRRRQLDGDTLRLLARISDTLAPDAPDGHALDAGVGELAAGLGEQELALRSWLRVAARPAAPVGRGDPAGRHDAYLAAARAAYHLGRADEARDLLRLARAAPGLTAEASVAIDALQADIELWLDHRTRDGTLTAERALREAEEMARAAGGVTRLTRPGQRAYLAALVAASDAALQEDRSDDVVRLSAAVMEVARELDDEAHVAALVRAGFAVRPLGRLRQSEAYFRAAWDLSHRIVLPTAIVEAGIGLARALRDMGRLREARAVAHETVDLESRLTNAPHRWGNGRGMLHSIELSLGDPAPALAALRDDALEERDPHFRLTIHESIAVWLARLGGGDASAEVGVRLATARTDSERAGCPRCAGQLLIVSSEVQARVGRVAEARRALESWDRRGGPRYLMTDLWRTRALAAIAVAEGDGQAHQLLEALVADLERAELLDDLLWARIDLGRVLEATDRERAVAVFTEAARLAAEMGAVTQGRLAAQALRRLGVRAWRRGPSAAGAGLGGLSPRERDVAGLAAEGASNREIAAALLISPKTVERHLTNILAKLGLRNRTELAARAGARPVRESPDE